MSEAQEASPTSNKPSRPTSPSNTDNPLRNTVDSLKNQLADLQTELSKWQQKANKAEREARQLRQILLELRSSEEQRGGEAVRKSHARMQHADIMSKKLPCTFLSHKTSHYCPSPEMASEKTEVGSFSAPRRVEHLGDNVQLRSPHAMWKGSYGSPHTTPKGSKSPKGRGLKGSMTRQVPQKQAHFGWQQYPMSTEKHGQRSGRHAAQQQLHSGVGRANQQHTRDSPSHKYLKKPPGPAPPDATKVAAEEALIECRQSLRNADNVESLQGAIEKAKSLGMKREASFGEAKLAKMTVVS